MRRFPLAALLALVLFVASCAEESGADDPISEPDITREVDGSEGE